jgi:hypothetical protein
MMLQVTFLFFFCLFVVAVFFVVVFWTQNVSSLAIGNELIKFKDCN